MDKGNSSFVNIPQVVSHFAGKFELGKKAASGIFDEVAILESTSLLQRRLIEIISREHHAKGELPIPELSFEGMRSNLRRRLCRKK